MTHRLVAASDASDVKGENTPMIPEPVNVRNSDARLGARECFICGERKPITAHNASGVLLPLCDDCVRFLREQERRTAIEQTWAVR